MKGLTALILATAIVAAAGSSAFAQVPAQGPAQVSESVFLTAQQPNQYLAADLLLKAKVHDGEGKIFGDIEDLILNENNQVEGVIIGIGGLFGAGEKRIGVRYSALQFTEKNGEPVVSLPQATKAVLDKLPAYQRSRPPKSFLQGVTERAKELTAKTTETTKDALKEAKKEAAPILEEAGKKAGEAYNQAKDAIEKAAE